MAECGESYINCANASESVESLFKRLILVDDDGNLSLQICGCCTVFDWLTLTPQDSAPSPAEEGMIYAGTDHHIYYYNGSAWVQMDNDPVA